MFDHPTPAGLVSHLKGLIGVEAKAAGEPVALRLGGLVTAVREAAADPVAFAQITAELRALLDAAEDAAGRHRPAVGGPSDGAGPALDSASDEELFALVNELD